MGVAQITFRDKLVPSQRVYREQFEGDEEAFYTALYEAVMRFSELKLPTEEFQLSQSDQFGIAEMASHPVLARFLQLLIFLKQPQRVLEIGTFLGIATMQMARALPPGGEVVTIEKYDHFAGLARQNFRANGLEDRIRLIHADAFEAIRELSQERFDMVFLDGNKERYSDYFRRLDPLVADKGVFLVDDVFFHGDALNQQPKSDKGTGVRKFLEYAESQHQYDKVILPIGNGLMVMRKRGAR